MILPGTPLRHHEFRPYAKCPAFAQVYKFDLTENRLTNRYSIDGAGVPLVIGGREDIDAVTLARLERNYLFPAGRVPHYLLVHHGLAAYAASEARQFGALSDGCTLFRFDAHPDSNNWISFKNRDLGRIYSASVPKAHEDSYVRPLVESGLVNRIVWFRSSPGVFFINRDYRQDFRDLLPTLRFDEVEEEDLARFDRGLISGLPRKRVILDIDPDYYAHLHPENMFAVANLIQYLFRKAGLIMQCFAPETIETQLAARYAVNLIQTV